MGILVILLLLFKQLIWISFIPIWQFPDEQAHFAQVQNISEGKGWLITGGNSTSKEIYESEKFLGTLRDGFGNNLYTYHPDYNIEYANSTTGIYEKTIKSFPISYRQDLVINEATGYPPFYYILSSIFYRSVYNQDLITRLFTTRLLNLILFLFTALFVWKTAQLIFPQKKINQISLLLMVTMQPMFSYVSAGVNSDVLYNLLFMVVLYNGLLLIKQPSDWKIWLSVLITVVASSWIKPQAKLIVLIYAYPIMCHLLTKIKRKNITWQLSLIFVIVTFIGFWSVIKNVVTGQQVLPDMPTVSGFTGLSIPSLIEFSKWSLVHAYRETMPWYWGVYRWLSLTYPRPIHRFINYTVLISLVGFITWCIKRFIYRKPASETKYFLFLIYSSIIYFLSLLVFDYLFSRFHGYPFGIQGRYYFPTILAHMSFILLGIDTIFCNQRLNKWIVSIIGGGMVLFHIYAQYLVIGSYFNVKDLTKFFTQASQYKPQIVKSPFLEFLLIITLVLIVLIILFLVRLLLNLKQYKQSVTSS